MMPPAPLPAATVVGGRVDSQGRLMLQRLDGTESVAGKVAGAPGAPGSPGSPGANATDDQVMAVLTEWFTQHPMPVPKDGINGKDGTNGKDGKDGTNGANATDAQVAAAAAAWMVGHPTAQAVTGIDVPATTITVGTQTRDITVTWPKPWPDAAYEVIGFVSTAAVLFGKITPGTAKGKTTTSCVLPVDIAATLSLGGAKLHVLGLRSS